MYLALWRKKNVSDFPPIKRGLKSRIFWKTFMGFILYLIRSRQIVHDHQPDIVRPVVGSGIVGHSHVIEGRYSDLS